MCQKDSSNLTHTVCFDVSIYRPIGEPDVTNERLTRILKLDTFFPTYDAGIMTHDSSQIRTTHRVDPALPGTGHDSVVHKYTYLHWVYRVPITHVNGPGLWWVHRTFRTLTEFWNRMRGHDVLFTQSPM